MAIHHPRHWIHQVGAQTHRAEKTVLHLEHRQGPLRCSLQQGGACSPPPHHHAFGSPGNPLPGRSKTQRGSRQETPQIALFPRGEAHGNQRAGGLRLQPPLQTNGAHQRFDAAELMPMGIHTATALHQSGMHQARQACSLLTAFRHGETVLAQSPARIERHTKAMHRPAPQQGFKPHL